MYEMVKILNLKLQKLNYFKLIRKKYELDTMI